MARVAGSGPEDLVKEAALRLLDDDARFRAAVAEGAAEADRGEFIEESEMECPVRADAELVNADPLDTCRRSRPAADR
jgi:predicted transcriptional regulator